MPLRSTRTAASISASPITGRAGGMGWAFNPVTGFLLVFAQLCAHFRRSPYRSLSRWPAGPSLLVHKLFVGLEHGLGRAVHADHPGLQPYRALAGVGHRRKRVADQEYGAGSRAQFAYAIFAAAPELG